MAPAQRTRIIIDTDPGVDDIFAILAALSAPGDLEVLLISITHGNVDAINCLRNTVTLFNIIEKEQKWRLNRNTTDSAGTDEKSRPIVALGAQEPISAVRTLADYYREFSHAAPTWQPEANQTDGRDGLGGTHTSHPHTTPPETWQDVFHAAKADVVSNTGYARNFVPSSRPSHQEILSILRENQPGEITIVAIGPLTNLALAAQEDRETFLRAKEIVVMGGTVDVPGNITPVAEFNTYADPHAAELLFSLTNPAALPSDGTVPTTPKVVLLPLDLTVPHVLKKSHALPTIQHLRESGSPLAEWIEAILGHTYTRVSSMAGQKSEAEDVGLSMHDPLCIWYVLSKARNETGWSFSPNSPEDIRVETEGKWTRGMCVTDNRNRPKAEGPQKGDRDSWLNSLAGNRIWRVVGSPGIEMFPQWVMQTIFATQE